MLIYEKAVFANEVRCRRTLLFARNLPHRAAAITTAVGTVCLFYLVGEIRPAKKKKLNKKK
jgi:hypothetical protein